MEWLIWPTDHQIMKNGRFASHPAVMGKMLGIIYRTIATHLTHKAGFTTTTAKPGAVTLNQRFGSALNLNIPQGTFS